MPLARIIKAVPVLALWLAVLGGGLLGYAPAAQASTSCSASMSNVSFGSVSPFGGNIDVTATINYSCSITSILSSSKVRACFGIGSGAQGGGALDPRVMTSGVNSLGFNLYKSAARTDIWGSRSNAYGGVEVTLELGALIGSTTQTGSLTVYARVPSGQLTAVPASDYSNSFSGVHTELVYQYNEFLLGLLPTPASCTSGGNGGSSGTFPFTASATVTASCDPVFTIDGIDFGTRGLLASNFDAVAVIHPRCTNTTPYQLGLNDGLYASGSLRRMKSTAGAYVGYQLYRDSGRSQRWGNTQNVDTVAGSGSGSAQNVQVYGRVAPQATPAAGSYTDTVTVTIYY
ncbi:spore coat protein U domain-containing protein [Solimonas sp. SE-A11]|uniref:Csu type fimbrial protein n=1 Tax=Solimonas sp. SE-A11 TaxID=3054954 RepID=UPI00259CD676|nr:spore coat protein U domain-containing protein [Solimonas sp. SE-A11]MDM4771969.1 spore coat protein U domain-containing protein [Solimonas sp. SE-A11]